MAFLYVIGVESLGSDHVPDVYENYPPPQKAPTLLDMDLVYCVVSTPAVIKNVIEAS